MSGERGGVVRKFLSNGNLCKLYTQNTVQFSNNNDLYLPYLFGNVINLIFFYSAGLLIF